MMYPSDTIAMAKSFELWYGERHGITVAWEVFTEGFKRGVEYERQRAAKGERCSNFEQSSVPTPSDNSLPSGGSDGRFERHSDVKPIEHAALGPVEEGHARSDCFGPRSDGSG